MYNTELYGAQVVQCTHNTLFVLLTTWAHSVGIAIKNGALMCRSYLQCTGGTVWGIMMHNICYAWIYGTTKPHSHNM